MHVRKTCFVISHIGEPGSEEELKANRTLNYFIKPVLKNMRYSVIRSDHDPAPGLISPAIIQHLRDSDLVIADISENNPNVFYELAVRHAVNKPVIIIKKSNQKPPFDIKDNRAISIDMTKPEVWQPAMFTLKCQIQASEKDPTKTSRSILSDIIRLESIPHHESTLIDAVKEIQENVSRLTSLHYSDADNRIHEYSSVISNYEDFVRKCLESIEFAEKEIIIAARFENELIINAILKKASAGVKVKVLADKDMITTYFEREPEKIYRKDKNKKERIKVIANPFYPSRVERRYADVPYNLLIVDGKKIIIEIIHNPDMKKFKMAIHVVDKKLAHPLKNLFNSLWLTANVNPPQLLKYK